MRRLAAFAIASAILASVPASASAQAWLEPAAALNQTEAAGVPFDGQRNTRNVGGPVLETIDGALHAAWTEWDGTNLEVRVARLDGNEWVSLGSGCSPINADSARNAFDVSLTEHDGRPMVAWVEVTDSEITQVQAARYDAATDTWSRPWGQVTDEPRHPGNQPNFYGHGLNQSYGTDVESADGRAYVAARTIRPIPTVNQVFRLRADGTKFEKIGAPQSFDSFGLKIEADGDELFGLTSDTTSTYVSRLDGDTFTDLPGFAPQNSSYSVHAFTVRNDVPYVLYTASGELARVKRFVGGAWQTVGEPVHLAAELVPDMAFVGTSLHVATISGGRITVRRQTQTGSWEQAGNTHVNHTESTHPDDPRPTGASLAALGGRPYAGWAAWDGQRWKARVAGLLEAAPAAVPAREQLTGCAAQAPDGNGNGEGTAGGDTTGQGNGGTATGSGAGTGTDAVPTQTAPSREQQPSRSRTPRLVLLNPRNRARNGIVRLRVRCAGGARCRGTAIARARSRIQGLEIGRVRVNMAPGEVRTIRLRLTPTAIRMIRRGSVRYALTLRTPV